MLSKTGLQVMLWKNADFTLSAMVSSKNLTAHAKCALWNMKENLICRSYKCEQMLKTDRKFKFAEAA